MPRPILHALTALMLLVGCTRESVKAPDVVLVVLDAAATRRFGLYGHDRDTTPNIDALARDSIVWERAYAQAPQTTASVASFMTGRYPLDAWSDRRIRGPALAERLQSAGYRTVGLSENPWVAAERGFDRGFDSFEVFDFEGGARPDSPASSPTLARARAALDADGSRPLFLYIHLLPPHSPYRAPAPMRGLFAEPPKIGHESAFLAMMLGETPGSISRTEILDVMSGKSPLPPDAEALLRDRYDENLAWADAQVGALLDALGARARLERSLFIVTADHGEAFGEHDLYGHSTALYDEQIRVPLIVRLPEQASTSDATTKQRRAEPVQLVDLHATILDVVGLQPADESAVPGASLLGSDLGARGPVRSFLGRRAQAIVSGPFKLIVPTNEMPQLFDLEADPGETNDLASERPDVVARLRALLWTDPAGKAADPAPGLGDVDDETRRQLERLGYLD